jgi:hypothetical protein
METETEVTQPETPQSQPEDSGAQAADSTQGEGTPQPTEGAQTPEPTPQEKMVSEKRFKEVYWQWKQAEREKEELEARIAPATQPQPQQAQTLSGKPKIEDFDDYATYNEALVSWLLAEERRSFEQRQVQTTRQHRFKEFDQKIAEEVARDPQFGQKAFIPTPMLDYFVESEDPVSLALYFGQHQQEAARISNLSALSAAREIGKIEAKIAAKAAGPAQRFQTNAPDPTAPVDGKTKVPVDTENMTTAQWIAHRDALTAKGELY